MNRAGDSFQLFDSFGYELCGFPSVGGLRDCEPVIVVGGELVAEKGGQTDIFTQTALLSLLRHWRLLCLSWHSWLKIQNVQANRRIVSCLMWTLRRCLHHCHGEISSHPQQSMVRFQGLPAWFERVRNKSSQDSCDPLTSGGS